MYSYDPKLSFCMAVCTYHNLDLERNLTIMHLRKREKRVVGIEVRFIIADKINICWYTLKAVRSAEATLSLVTTPTANYLRKSHAASRKPVYPAWWRNRPPLACRKLFRVMTYECRIYRTIGEMSDIETFVITDGNREQTALCVVYGKFPFWMSAVFLSTQTLTL